MGNSDESKGEVYFDRKGDLVQKNGDVIIKDKETDELIFDLRRTKAGVIQFWKKLAQPEIADLIDFIENSSSGWGAENTLGLLKVLGAGDLGITDELKNEFEQKMNELRLEFSGATEPDEGEETFKEAGVDRILSDDKFNPKVKLNRLINLLLESGINLTKNDPRNVVIRALLIEKTTRLEFERLQKVEKLLELLGFSDGEIDTVRQKSIRVMDHEHPVGLNLEKVKARNPGALDGTFWDRYPQQVVKFKKNFVVYTKKCSKEEKEQAFRDLESNGFPMKELK